MTPFKDLLDRTAAALSRVVLAWAARRMTPARREWIEAMRAELDEAGPGVAQLGWAVGGLSLVCREKAQAAAQNKRLTLPVLALAILFLAPFQRVHVLVPVLACAWLILNRTDLPTAKAGRHRRVLQAFVLTGVAACLGLAVYGVRRYPNGGSVLNPSSLLFAAVLAGYVCIALTPRGTVAAPVARRCGVIGGVGTGFVSLLGNVPVAPAVAGWIGMGVELVAPVAIGIWAGTRSDDHWAGLEAGLWSGMIGALIFFVGLVSLTYAATGWFAHDPRTIADFRSSWSPQTFHAYQNHYHSITAFLVRDNLGQASAWLALSPVLGAIFGGLGGALGWSTHPAAEGKSNR